MLSKAAKIDVIKLHHESKSYSRIQQCIQEKYGQITSRMGISKIVIKFENHGSIEDRRKINKGSLKEVRRHKNFENIQRFLEANPRSSTRTIAQNLGISQYAVWKNLKKMHYKPFKIRRHQELLERDFERRRNFCFDMMETLNENRNMLNNIVFTDECTFTLNNEPNVQNTRRWSPENPHRLAITRTQYPEKVNVWVGILGNDFVGPIFIDGNLTGEKFLDLLRNEIIPRLLAMGKQLKDIIFQLDGCPAHQVLRVKEYLKETFCEVIGPYNDVWKKWPARSPDLSPNDFFLWGHIKSSIYSEDRIQNKEELKNKIAQAIDSLTQQMMQNVRNAFYNRLTYCLAENGNVFEYLL